MPIPSIEDLFPSLLGRSLEGYKIGDKKAIFQFDGGFMLTMPVSTKNWDGWSLLTPPEPKPRPDEQDPAAPVRVRFTAEVDVPAAVADTVLSERLSINQYVRQGEWSYHLTGDGRWEKVQRRAKL